MYQTPTKNDLRTLANFRGISKFQRETEHAQEKKLLPEFRLDLVKSSVIFIGMEYIRDYGLVSDNIVVPRILHSR